MTTSTARLRSEAGFTLFEMLVSTGLIVLITGSVFSLLNPSYGTFQAQPEVSDMQQRLRVAADTDPEGPGDGRRRHLFRVHGRHARQLLRADPAAPRRAPSAPTRPGSFRANPLCPTRARRRSRSCTCPTPTRRRRFATDMPTPSAELKVHQQPGCGEDDRDLCGFNDGDRVLIFDPSGAYDIFTITNVQDNALHLQHRDDKFTQKYYAGAWITKVESHTYYLNEVPATNTYQLRHYDGYQTDLPVADNVVDFRVEFFGDPLPPQIVRPGHRPERPLDDLRPQAAGDRHRQRPRTRGAPARTACSTWTAPRDFRWRARRSRRWVTALDRPGAASGQHAHRRSVVPVGDQHGRRRHAEQVRRGPAARAPGARHPARAGGQRGPAGARRRALPTRRPVAAAASASCRTRKSASTCRRAT